MDPRINGDLKYYTFSSFPSRHVRHAVFTRAGGVSPEPFSSLNVGGLAGDTYSNVVENRRRMLFAFNPDSEGVYDVWQVHGNRVVYTTSPRNRNQQHERADAIVTDRINLSLFMQFADCVPILLYDPVKHVAGIAHAGWQGTVKRTVQHTVRFMTEKFETDPQHLIAGIGPSIGPDHYEVGENVLQEVKQNLNEFYSSVIRESNNGTYFDLWKGNELLLRQSGVRQIEVASICTACHPEEWFSYRKEGRKSGRFGALIALK
jgi:YfiH family protein